MKVFRFRFISTNSSESDLHDWLCDRAFRHDVSSIDATLLSQPDPALYEYKIQFNSHSEFAASVWLAYLVKEGIDILDAEVL